MDTFIHRMVEQNPPVTYQARVKTTLSILLAPYCASKCLLAANCALAASDTRTSIIRSSTATIESIFSELWLIRLLQSARVGFESCGDRHRQERLQITQPSQGDG